MNEKQRKDKQFCCTHFEQLVPYLAWYKFDKDGRETARMPCLDMGEFRKAVNFCPVCGAKVSQIELDYSEILAF